MIRQHYTIQAPPTTVWRALTDVDWIKRWSSAPAQMSAKSGSSFKLWNGDIWGTNTFVDAPRHLEQDWFAGQWAKPSKLCIALNGNDTQTVVVICHSHLPKGEEKKFADGWKKSYFDPLKAFVEAAA